MRQAHHPHQFIHPAGVHSPPPGPRLTVSGLQTPPLFRCREKATQEKGRGQRRAIGGRYVLSVGGWPGIGLPICHRIVARVSICGGCYIPSFALLTSPHLASSHSTLSYSNSCWHRNTSRLPTLHLFLKTFVVAKSETPHGVGQVRACTSSIAATSPLGFAQQSLFAVTQSPIAGTAVLTGDFFYTCFFS